MRPRYLHFLALASLALGCNQPVDEPPPIAERIQLQAFASCGELEQYIEDTAVSDMRYQLDQLKDQSRGWFGGGPEAAGGDANAAPKQAAEPAAYTTTNLQVKGVDEADFMKNDGTRIFVLSGQKLYAARSWPADQMSLASSITIEGWPREMFLDEKNRVIVVSGVYSKYADSPYGEGGPCGGNWGCGYAYANTTKVTVVDVTNLGAPKVTGEHYLPGSYNRSRRIGGSVRLVLADAFRWPQGVKWYPDYNAADPNLWNDKVRLAAVIEQLKSQNERLIRARTLDQWLPKGRRKLDGGQIVDVGYQCGDFHRANASIRLGLVTVATLNVDKPAQDPTRTAIVAQPGEIYASPTSLYIASQHWWWWPAPGQSDFTYVHKFDITNPDRAVYVASGGAEGHIVDQFSMDEHKGFFRIATTISRRVPDLKNPMNRWGLIETTNRISVLGEKKGGLVLFGQSQELAKGERIFSSRFVGDKGFIVTFRQVDPLFTFDLSNPAQPRQVGELKVPGFSTYIHPIDDNHLLTIGTYQPEPGPDGRIDWRERRMKLSVFDVSDFAHPKEKFGYLIGTAYGWSEAMWEHKAFNYFPERKLLAIPFSDYTPGRSGDSYWQSFVSEARVFHVDLQKGVTPRGALNMKDLYRQYGDYGWSWYYTPWIRRTVMASDQAGNEFLYAVSDVGIRSAALGNIAQPLSTVMFDKVLSR